MFITYNVTFFANNYAWNVFLMLKEEDNVKFYQVPDAFVGKERWLHFK